MDSAGSVPSSVDTPGHGHGILGGGDSPAFGFNLELTTPNSPLFDYGNLTPLDFTNILYNGDDWLSFVLAIISMCPQTLLVVYATLIISRREAETILLLGGQVGCELVNHYLKRVIREKRPKLIGDGYGMPSAHAQFMAFYATYIILWMSFRARYFSRRKKLLRGAGLVLLAAVVSYSRVYLHYHTGMQVLAGVTCGIITGIAFFMLIVLIRDLGIVDLLLDTYPARWFYIKDTAGEKSSYVQDEYSEWRKLRMKMKLLIKVD